MKRSMSKAKGAALAAIPVPIFALSGTEMASAIQPSDVPANDVVDAVSAAEGVYRTLDGLSINVVSEVGDPAERTVTGYTAAGSPVEIVIQSSGVTDDDRAVLAADAVEPVDEEALRFSESHSGPESGTIDATPLDMSPENWKPIAVIAKTESTASFAWLGHQFDVSSGGQSLGTSVDGQVTLTDLKPGEDYSVELTPSDRDSQRSATETSPVRMTTFTTFSGDKKEDEPRVISPLTYQPYYNQYVHKSFIPDRRVPGSQCNFFVPGWEFGGDNRSFQWPAMNTPWDAANYRTMMFVNVSWRNPAPYNISWTKNVGATQTFFNGALQNTLYADMGGMQFEDASAGSSYAKIYLDHSAGNPGCKLWDASYGGTIRYAEWVEFYRSGTVAVEGYRFAAPAHELYAKFTTSAGNEVPWSTISRRSNQGFQCLLGNAFCPLDFYNVSASY